MKREFYDASSVHFFCNNKHCQHHVITRFRVIDREAYSISDSLPIPVASAQDYSVQVEATRYIVTKEQFVLDGKAYNLCSDCCSQVKNMLQGKDFDLSKN